METSVNNYYLHKKFKKQLSVIDRRQPHQPNDKTEKKEIRNVESGEEKRECSKIVVIDDSLTSRTDNKESVPNQSTNHNSFYVSSISLDNPIGNIQSPNLCISRKYIYETQNYNDEQAIRNNVSHNSFDTRFNATEPTEFVANTSSILKSSLYFNPNYVSNDSRSPSDVSMQTEKNNFYEDSINSSVCVSERKLHDDVPTSSDRGGSGGKYVCTYCNLACSKPSVLQKHIRAHTNERPYPCVSCGFSFKTRSNLYKHCRSRTHANRVLGNKAQEMNEMEVDSNVYESNTKSLSPKSISGENLALEKSNDYKSKVYKPRFHTSKTIHEPHLAKENINEEIDEEIRNQHANSDILSHHINEIITKNNSIVHESHFYKKKTGETDTLNNNEYINVNQRIRDIYYSSNSSPDEPLNLTKNRKRAFSEVAEPPTQKSLIKELLLKNLSSDMQCPHCKMIFQTVTELELHKLRSCKGFVKPGAKYMRSNSVNVASILTQNKNAFDNLPRSQHFPLKSPGPFLGKTRLVESDKTKSFSFDDGLPILCKTANEDAGLHSRYLLSPLGYHEKKPLLKLFGGEVKITHNSGEAKSFKFDNKNEKFNNDRNYTNYACSMSENRVVKSTLQSGGTCLTNKPNYNKQESVGTSQDVIRVYDNTLISPNIDMPYLGNKFPFEEHPEVRTSDKKKPPNLVLHPIGNVGTTTSSPSYKYTNIVDFSQNAMKLLTPNLKRPNLMVPGLPVPTEFVYNNVSIVENRLDSNVLITQPLKIEIEDNVLQNFSNDFYTEKKRFENIRYIRKPNAAAPLKLVEPIVVPPQTQNSFNPMSILVNGKVVRYVPGIPGPIIAEVSPQPRLEKRSHETKIQTQVVLSKVPHMERLEIEIESGPKMVEQKSPKNTELRSPVIKTSEMKSPLKVVVTEMKKFARPNSLALKPTTASLKQHHGLTPTIHNQILISPDTPRVAKKYVQQYLNGNYFSYLGLKSTTRLVYCTLNKTQPFYVPHFKKLSMYSEWRQQDTKNDKSYTSGYSTGQRNPKYTVANRQKNKSPDVVHSSYKFIASENSSLKGERTDDGQKINTSIVGGYECNEDYTYVRGRGRGRYVCEQCGIRCKKPSMLKKHIRTHSNDRPYTCNLCNFSFKTKGNLTKHMKSKAHSKNYSATSSGSNSSNQQSGTQSSDSDTDDSGLDSSDESTRQQEHEAAYGLLSLSQKTTHTLSVDMNSEPRTSPSHENMLNPGKSDQVPKSKIMNNDEINYASKTTYAKNKFLGQPVSALKLTNIKDMAVITDETKNVEADNFSQILGKTSANRPLTYPYTSDFNNDDDMSLSPQSSEDGSRIENRSSSDNEPEPKNIKQFHVIQKYASNMPQSYAARDQPQINGTQSSTITISYSTASCTTVVTSISSYEKERTVIVSHHVSNEPVNWMSQVKNGFIQSKSNCSTTEVEPVSWTNQVKNGFIQPNSNRSTTEVVNFKKRKFSIEENNYDNKARKSDEVMDLSTHRKNHSSQALFGSKLDIADKNSVPFESGSFENKIAGSPSLKTFDPGRTNVDGNGKVLRFDLPNDEDNARKESEFENTESNKPKNNGKSVAVIAPLQTDIHRNGTNVNFVLHEPKQATTGSSPKHYAPHEYDNSAMETLADIATKQVKLEKNTLAKNVASEFLKLATQNEFGHGEGGGTESNRFTPLGKDVNDLIGKPEGNKSCAICSKSFNKPSQLRLHMNIHYLERPFRCFSCSVSFRTKGHLQKHERSAGHHNKLSTSPALSSSEPRPFKCADCSIAFRIHGHLAKHLRSKMHIMKLECLAKIPFGLYAELERSNSLLTEINTTDGDQCLNSLKILATKVFLNDPGKLKQISEPTEIVETDNNIGTINI